jgi:hypothetical protein
MSRRAIIGILLADYTRAAKAEARLHAEQERPRERSQKRGRAGPRPASERTSPTNKGTKKACEDSRTADVAALNAEAARRKEALQTILQDRPRPVRPLFDLLRAELLVLEIRRNSRHPALPCETPIPGSRAELPSGLLAGVSRLQTLC